MIDPFDPTAHTSSLLVPQIDVSALRGVTGVSSMHHATNAHGTAIAVHPGSEASHPPSALASATTSGALASGTTDGGGCSPGPSLSALVAQLAKEATTIASANAEAPPASRMVRRRFISSPVLRRTRP